MPASRAVAGRRPPAPIPGFRRAPCIGCGAAVVAARDALVTIVGTRDGSWLSAFPIEPQLIWADPLPAPAGTCGLGVSHRHCLEDSFRLLRAGQVSLDQNLPKVQIEDAADDDPWPDLTLPPKAHVCAFCHSTSGSDEHIWAKWISRTLGGAFVVQHEHGKRKTGTIPFTTSRVCGRCNNGWLSGLENDSKPVLARLVLGSDVDLGTPEQELLATWSYKTALMLDLEFGGVVQLGYHRQFEIERRPPHSALVWIGAYIGRQAASAHVQALQLGAPAGEPPLAVSTTFTAGRLLVQVFHHFTVGSATFDDRREGAPFLDQVWPTGEPFRWPRRRVGFNDQQMQDLIEGVVDPQ